MFPLSVTIEPPSGENATRSTHFDSAMVRASCPVDASQILTALSAPADAIHLPSGEKTAI
jgi:hypothetical protein